VEVNKKGPLKRKKGDSFLRQKTMLLQRLSGEREPGGTIGVARGGQEEGSF